MSKNLICIMCPKGCHLTIDENNNVTGNSCPQGKKYAIAEMTNPTRIVTSTVRVNSTLVNRLPVITSCPIPKGMMFDIIKALEDIVVETPVHVKDVIIKNVLGLDADIVATRTLEK